MMSERPVAFVTGASRGIGRAMAEEMAAKPVVKEMYESLQAHQAKVNAWNELQSLD